MTQEDVFQAIAGIDERFIAESARYAPEAAAGAPERIVRMRKKRIFSLALAAALILGLGTAAYAISVSIHRQRQEELRQELKIDENHVADYVEYPVAEAPEDAPADGATLLSAMNDGEFQHVWVVLNDVTPEMLARLEFSEQVDWEGEKLPANGHRYAEILATLDGNSFFFVSSHKFRDGYDPGSRTLTVSSAIPLDELEEGQRVSLRFVLMDVIDYEMDRSEAEPVCELGSVEIERTGQTIRTVWFPEPIPFENGDYGAGEFLGAEISASGVNWILRHDGASEMYRSHEFADEEELRAFQAMELSWLAVIEDIERGAFLTFADGSSVEVWLPLSSINAGNNIVKDVCRFEGRTIDPGQLVSITIGGQTFEIG